MKTIPYEEKFGTIDFPEGFAEKLRSETLEEQMGYYRIASSAAFTRTSYGQVDSKRLMERTHALTEDEDCVGLVVKDGVLVGVLIRSHWGRETPCLPYQRVCTYYASDNEGSGTKDRVDYACLVCV